MQSANIHWLKLFLIFLKNKKLLSELLYTYTGEDEKDEGETDKTAKEIETNPF